MPVGASLALGLPDFLGFKIGQAARVMMFYLEDDGGEIQTKLQRIFYSASLPGLGNTRPAFSFDSGYESTQGRFALYTRDDFRAQKIPINSTNGKFLEFVDSKLKAHRPDLIVFDNLSHLVRGDYGEARVIDQLRWIQCTVWHSISMRP